MKKSFFSVLPLTAVLMSGLLLPTPQATAQAATTKQIAGATRCITKNMKALHEKALKRFATDTKKVAPGYDEAILAYKAEIDFVWQMMYEPYCGYGTRGVTAVANGFNKSITQARGRFLKALKKAPNVVAKIPAPAPAVQTPVSAESDVPNPLGIKF
ncbi:MAG: hypothetical protein Q7R83_03190 [bacterium]|nr:hypothetical protein [bacterium]